MDFWNFMHDSVGIHIYVLLMFIVLAIMLCIAIIHHIRQTRRETNNNKELERLREQLKGSPAPEEPAAQTAVQEAKA